MLNSLHSPVWHPPWPLTLWHRQPKAQTCAPRRGLGFAGSGLYVKTWTCWSTTATWSTRTLDWPSLCPTCSSTPSTGACTPDPAPNILQIESECCRGDSSSRQRSKETSLKWFSVRGPELHPADVLCWRAEIKTLEDPQPEYELCNCAFISSEGLQILRVRLFLFGRFVHLSFLFVCHRKGHINICYWYVISWDIILDINSVNMCFL